MALQDELDRVRLRELLDELAEQLGPPDEDMVAETVGELTAPRTPGVPPIRCRPSAAAVTCHGHRSCNRDCRGEPAGKNRLDSRNAVDAFVAAPALGASPAVVLTGDPDASTRLIADDPGVLVQPLP
ncbi:MAG: hypothetical protein ABR615_08060 [Pseudonocardiaceae bacterium]